MSLENDLKDLKDYAEEKKHIRTCEICGDPYDDRDGSIWSNANELHHQCAIAFDNLENGRGLEIKLLEVFADLGSEDCKRDIERRKKAYNKLISGEVRYKWKKKF